MPSFSATLRFADATHSVLTCDYLFYQSTDDAGNAVSKVRSGEITVLVNGCDDDKPLAWAANPLHKLDGEVIFFRTDLLAGIAERLVFKQASCVSYVELFEPAHPVSSYLLELKIVANELTLNNVEHSNEWADHV